MMEPVQPPDIFSIYSKAEAAEIRKDYPLIWLPDVKPHITEKALVRGVIKPESMIVTYGESGSGKTFSVLDRDLCIATGRLWFDRETEKGLVIYVAAEGPHSVENRIFAYREAYIDNPAEALFALLPKAIDLRNPTADTSQIIDFVKRVEDERQTKCKKITIDTLSRVMAGGNENGPEDMGALVCNADYIRQEIGCCLEFIHHSGKDAARGARGHSLLRAATDTEIEVTNDDGLHVSKITKQRDFEQGDEFALTLNPVSIGMDEHGHEITTCIPEWKINHQPVKKINLTKQEHAVLKMMQEIMRADKKLAPIELLEDPRSSLKPGQIACPVGDLRGLVNRNGGLSESDKPDSQRRALSRCLNSLRSKNFIGVLDEWAWLADKPDKAGHL